MEFLKHYPQHNQVYYLTPELPDFEGFYLKVREIEGRVYTDEFVQQLPYPPADHIQKKEWDLRIKTIDRFCTYLKENNSINSILDLGCGNGWFSHFVSQQVSAAVLGVDVNKMELEQAGRVFNQVNLSFAYGDLFHPDFPVQKYDLIVMNSSAHYFESFQILIDKLKTLLHTGGEIHLLDSSTSEAS